MRIGAVIVNGIAFIEDFFFAVYFDSKLTFDYNVNFLSVMGTVGRFVIRVIWNSNIKRLNNFAFEARCKVVINKACVLVDSHTFTFFCNSIKGQVRAASFK